MKKENGNRDEVKKRQGNRGEEGRENNRVRRMTELAMLTAVALIIFVVELQIPNPFPVPGVKLGLANIITVYAVYHYRPREVMMLVSVRIFLGALFCGVMSTLIYSFAGSVFCLAGMLLFKRVIEERYIWFASVLGAVLHNAGQLSAAFLVTQTAGIFVYFPFLLVSGCLAGAFTGICAQLILRRNLGKDTDCIG